jgi:hypothetical protein
MIRLETMPAPGDHAYNVRPEECSFPEDGEEDFEDPTEYIWSVKALPPAGAMEEERRRLVVALEDLIRTYLADRGIPPSDDVFSYHSIGRCPSTREMWFYLGRTSAFSAPLIGRLQRMLTGQFPLWRIVAAYEHLNLVVYPEGVWFGANGNGRFRNDDFVRGSVQDDEPAFARWLAEARSIEPNL